MATICSEFHFIGYMIHTGIRRSHGTQALQLIVQGKHDPEFVEERIENFLAEFRVLFSSCICTQFIIQQNCLKEIG